MTCENPLVPTRGRERKSDGQTQIVLVLDVIGGERFYLLCAALVEGGFGFERFGESGAAGLDQGLLGLGGVPAADCQNGRIPAAPKLRILRHNAFSF